MGDAGLKKPAYIWAIFLVLPAVLLGLLIYPSYALSKGDWSTLIYPFYSFARDTYVTEGRLPMWNPYIYCGMPHLVSLNTIVLYPTELAAIILNLPPSVFYPIDLVFHLALAGFGMFLLMRHEGCSPSGAFTGGLGYMLGNHLTTLAAGGHPHWVRAMELLPFILILLEIGRCRRSLKHFAFAGAVLGLVQLTAAMQFVAYAAPVLAIWILLRGESGRPADYARRIGALGLFLAVAAVCGAILLLPGFQYYLHSVRAVPDRVMQSQLEVPPIEMTALVVPSLFGAQSSYFGPRSIGLTSDYFGSLLLSLAVLGACCAPRRVLCWIVLAMTAAVLAMGSYTPVGSLLAGIPVFSGFRAPGKWLSFLHLAVAALAAHGWDAVRDRKPTWRNALAAGCFLAGLTALILADRPSLVSDCLCRADYVKKRLGRKEIDIPRIDATLSRAFSRAGVSGICTAAALAQAGLTVLPFYLRNLVLWGVLTADLAWNAREYFVTEPYADIVRPDELSSRFAPGRAIPPFRIWEEGFFFRPNLPMFHGIHLVSGYQGLPLRRPTALATVAASGPGSSARAALSAMNVRYTVSLSPPPLGTRRIGTARGPAGEMLTISENPRPLPRAFFARRLLPCVDLDQVFLAMQDPGWDPLDVPTDSPMSPAVADENLFRDGRIALEYGRDVIKARVETRGPAVVVFSEVWYPDWKAYVDGARVKVLRAYGCFRALDLVGGSHEIAMIYDSILFKIGLLVSAFAFTAVFVLGVFSFRPISL